MYEREDLLEIFNYFLGEKGILKELPHLLVKKTVEHVEKIKSFLTNAESENRDLVNDWFTTYIESLEQYLEETGFVKHDIVTIKCWKALEEIHMDTLGQNMMVGHQTCLFMNTTLEPLIYRIKEEAETLLKDALNEFDTRFRNSEDMKYFWFIDARIVLGIIQKEMNEKFAEMERVIDFMYIDFKKCRRWANMLCEQYFYVHVDIFKKCVEDECILLDLC